MKKESSDLRKQKLFLLGVRIITKNIRVISRTKFYHSFLYQDA